MLAGFAEVHGIHDTVECFLDGCEADGGIVIGHLEMYSVILTAELVGSRDCILLVW